MKAQSVRNIDITQNTLQVGIHRRVFFVTTCTQVVLRFPRDRRQENRTAHKTKLGVGPRLSCSPQESGGARTR